MVLSSRYFVVLSFFFPRSFNLHARGFLQDFRGSTGSFVLEFHVSLRFAGSMFPLDRQTIEAQPCFFYLSRAHAVFACRNNSTTISSLFFRPRVRGKRCDPVRFCKFLSCPRARRAKHLEEILATYGNQIANLRDTKRASFLVDQSREQKYVVPSD